MDRGLLSWRELGIFEGMIQLEMLFPVALDADKLGRAAALLLDMQPVLGCRMVAHPKNPFWQRLGEAERANFFVARDGAEFVRFKNMPLDIFNSPQAAVYLLPEGAGCRVLIKVSHEVSDAGGVKEVGADLCSLYNALGRDPGFVPAPNVSGSRSAKQVLRRLRISKYPGILVDALRELWDVSVPAASHSLPVPATSDRTIKFSERHIPAERVLRLSEYGRARGATLNDMLIAAVYRSMAAVGGWDGKSQLRLSITFDLRRWYLDDGRPGGICNLSSFEFPNLGANLGKDFEETLSRVNAFTRRRKARLPGIPRLSWLAMFKLMSYSRLVRFFDGIETMAVKHRNFSDAFTNMGPIKPGDISFDGQCPSAAWLLAPAALPPLFAAGLSGYAGTLTISAGAPVPCMEIVDAFLDRAVAELPE